MQYHPLFNTPEAREIKDWICEVGRRVYNKGFAAANDGNISYRIGENEVLCSPTMICKGFMTPEDVCMVDLDGNQLAGKKKRTSEILLHLTIMKHRPDVKAVVHCHPPHATAFAVCREAIPQCILPEIEVFLGEVPLAPYETPGGQAFADTVVPFLEATNTIILTNHGTVSFGKDLVEAYWKTEILDAYCRILILSKQMGGVHYLNEQKSRELLDLKKRLGFDDPRAGDAAKLLSQQSNRLNVEVDLVLARAGDEASDPDVVNAPQLDLQIGGQSRRGPMYARTTVRRQ